MKFIRDNIVKIILVFGILIVAIVILIACSGNSSNAGKARTYSKIEDNLKTAATRFLQRRKDLLPKEEGKILKVQMDTIYSEKELKKIVSPEDPTVRCDGYVNVSFRVNENDEKVYRVVPHIKCGDKYETEDLYVHILENEPLVQELDGLYKIGDEYVFRGEEPNNYIQIGERLYRIVSIDSDGYIKIINAKNTYLNTIWDNRYNTATNRYDGINDYYVSRIRDVLKDYYKKDGYYSDEEKNVFVKRSFCIGKRSESNIAISRDEECSQTMDEDYLSLPILYDYYIASVDSNCKNITDEACNNYNYLDKLGTNFTITGSKERTNYVYQMGTTNYLTKTENSRKVSLIAFISNVSYASGKGTKDDPYLIK